MVSPEQYQLIENELRHVMDTMPISRRPLQLGLKRSIDIAISLSMLIALSPLLLVIALAIKLTTKGPIFYRQLRLGQNAEIFTMLKFRTMVDGADGLLDDVFHLNEASGPLFKTRNDPRITPLGRFLRRHFWDELPQLINVLRGEMSLVGPRPCLIEEASRHPSLAFRFTVPQGVTGPWQTNGHHAITFEQQLDVERHYVEAWGLGTDFGILGRTIPLLVHRSGV